MAIEARCTDGCGKSTTEKEAEHQGWQRLQITGRWRCPDCTMDLARINMKDKQNEQRQHGQSSSQSGL